LTIGEFSKMPYLSVKALRHYHDVGLLEPAEIDPASGYRRYRADQVATAQAIRRFRELDMPIDQVRTVLEAPDLATRNHAILDHLATMQEQLERTQQTVASLQSLLTTTTIHPPVEYRTLPASVALTITGTIRLEDSAWLDAAFAELHAAIAEAGVVAAGADGALYPEELFTEGEGDVVAFVPVPSETSMGDGGRGRVLELPATRVAVMLHEGPYEDLDRTYGALGTAVAELGLGADGPIREVYLSDDRAEVCWPLSARP
jgi:DNA-binding transcriptional MerR regulator